MGTLGITTYNPSNMEITNQVRTDDVCTINLCVLTNPLSSSIKMMNSLYFSGPMKNL